MEKNKINSIILDCDDILLDYRKGFNTAYPGFENEHIYPKEKNLLFCKSKAFANLEPSEFAVEFVKALKSMGYKISIVTSVSYEKGVEEKRLENLANVFGPNTFDKIYVLGYFESKADALSKFPKSFFIDDMARNFIDSPHINIYKKKKVDNDAIPDGAIVNKTIVNLHEALEFITNYEPSASP